MMPLSVSKCCSGLACSSCCCCGFFPCSAASAFVASAFTPPNLLRQPLYLWEGGIGVERSYLPPCLCTGLANIGHENSGGSICEEETRGPPVDFEAGRQAGARAGGRARGCARLIFFPFSPVGSLLVSAFGSTFWFPLLVSFW